MAERDVCVGQYDSRIQANIFRAQLETHGISSRIEVDDAGGAYPVLQGGNVTLWVASQDADWAMRTLADQTPSSHDVDGDLSAAESVVGMDRAQETSSSGIAMGLFFLIVGIAIGFLMGGARSQVGDAVAGTQEEDRNRDGIPDAWHDYNAGSYVVSRGDRNFDGRIDEWHEYDDGIPSRSSLDENFDGQPDAWIDYRLGQITSVRFDFDGNGETDSTIQYEYGVPRISFLAPNGGRVEREERFIDGLLREEYSISESGEATLIRQYDELGREVFPGN